MMKSIILLIMTTLASVIWSVPGQAFCDGTFGTDRARLGSSRMSENFYFNNEHPAGCSGTVSSFTYCYYRPDIVTDSDNYTFNFAVYRETSSSGTYEKVSPVFVVSRNGLSLSSFNCSQYTPSEPVAVETGDMLGACIFNPSGSSNELISIIGRHTSRISRLQRTSNRPNSCMDNSVPTSFSNSFLTTGFQGVLHLYANSIMELTVNPTNDGPPTTVPSDTTTQPTENPISGGTPSTGPSSTQPTASNTSDRNSSPNVGGVAAGVIVPLIALISIIVTVVVVVVVLLSRKRQGRTLFHSDTKMGTFGPNNNQVDGFEESDGCAVELESNTARDVSRDMNLRQFEEATRYETVHSDNPAITTLTKMSDGPAVELESNTACGVSKIEEAACYETIDSVNAMEPTLTKISDRPAVQLESNTAYGVSRDMNLRQFEGATCYETVHKDITANTTLTKKSSGSAVELESNTACGISRFGEAFYETIDSDNPANPTLTGGVVTNLKGNEAYGVSSGVGQSVQGADDNEYWNVTGQDDCDEYNYINWL